ncbi:MAG TPA: cupredoxin domain-containing protein [Chthoniobacterales bacterium]|nr:cupredoxin domain-containing protein [Chthoniobacterales bacterium]
MKILLPIIISAALSFGVVHAQEGQKINVTMTEYHFNMPATAKAGKTTFVVKNLGKKVHTFAIKGEGIDQKISPNPKPGETASLEVDLKPGAYEITCPVDFHTGRGMKTTLTIK